MPRAKLTRSWRELRLPPGALFCQRCARVVRLAVTPPNTTRPSFVSVPPSDDKGIEALLADYLIGADQRPGPVPGAPPDGPATPIPIPEAKPVVVNRTVPAVTPPTPFAGFSSSPTDEEFFRGRLFAEPLVPIGRATTLEENRALARALEAYQHGTPDATAPIDTFLRAHADTPWRASLLVNVGGRLREAGAYTRALAAWDDAWTLAQHATDPHGRAVADLAVAEWLMLSMSLMRIDEVETRLAAIATRDVRGSSGNRIAQVRAAPGLVAFASRPVRARRSARAWNVSRHSSAKEADGRGRRRCRARDRARSG